MTHQEIRQRLTYLLPAGITESEWNLITAKVLLLITEEIALHLIVIKKSPRGEAHNLAVKMLEDL